MSLKFHTQEPRLLSPLFIRHLCLLLVGMTAFFSGCEEEKIHSYVAPRIKVAVDNQVPVSSEPTRMLAAILRQPEETWFFKLTASPEEAASLREQFGVFVASTTFRQGQPSWQVPDDWVELAARPMRFTTYQIGRGGPEVSISTLPNNADETESAVANINRWRGQLGLSSLSSDQYLQALASGNDAEILPEQTGEVVTITTPAGKAVLIDFVGQMSGSGGPPFANMGRPPATSIPETPGSVPSGSGSDPGLTPATHWKPGKLNSFRIAAYEVGEGENIAEITLSTAGGDLLANINRWRGQVDLPAWSADELSAAKTNLIGTGYTADYVKLIGPAKAILGAVISRDGRTYFVKLSGPRELAEKEMKNFEDFVKTIRF